MVLYRKYRPQKFSDLVGQESITKTLLTQLEGGKISHGYLFCGTRGTGKTSTARILAKAVNCRKFEVGSRKSNKSEIRFGEPCNKCDSCLAVADGSHLDLIEIDAASNRNIDDVREIREKIKTSPVSARFKVYIIDEVHMLTKEAFNALLKTLEEPPPHAMFILCTTEVGKLPPTILSRVQRFNFRRANDDDLFLAVSKVARLEGIKEDKEAFYAIAKSADGSFRDAISTLDQVSGNKKVIDKKEIERVALASSWNGLYLFARSLLLGQVKEPVLYVDKLWTARADISAFSREAILLLENVLFAKLGISDTQSDLDDGQMESVNLLSNEVTQVRLQQVMKELLVAEGESRFYPLPHIALILAVCKLGNQESKEDGFEKPRENVDGEPQDEVKIEAKAQPVGKESKKRDVGKSNGKAAASVEVVWGNFVAKVKGVNNHVAAILRSTKPIGLSGDILKIGVYFRFHKDKLEEEKIRRMLEDIFSEISGKKVRFKYEVQTKNSPAGNVRETFESDLEKAAAEIFSK
ncbi:DNA polymerase III subunit gamma/tau [Candidatus Curtissbacteria bacterium]|nr:DNA polymerase III subunit gamma/tau [Candidatus Curtissbacteria bacterium]